MPSDPNRPDSVVALADRARSVLMLMEDYRGSYTRAATAQATSAESYDDLARAVFSRSIYYGDAYLDAFGKAGVEATQFIPACLPLQARWAREHGMHVPSPLLSQRPIRWYWTRRGRERPDMRALRDIVTEQVRLHRPDVLWVFSGVPADQDTVAEWSRHAGTLVLWWSCALVEGFPYERFDLILSSIPGLVDHFRGRGIRSEHMHHAFDPRILDRVHPAGRRIPRVVFVGNLSRDHGERVEFLDTLAAEVEVDFFGDGVEHLPPGSRLRARARAPVWGDELYRVYGDYAVAIHRNIDVAGSSASAKRLFEASGMGACVLVEEDAGITDLFVPGKEIATYADLGHAISVARDLTRDPIRARDIGQAGQARTLRDHTYEARVALVLDLLDSQDWPRVRPAAAGP